MELSVKRVFEIGCGNGATANVLSEHRVGVPDVDLSKSGITVAKKSFSPLHFHEDSAYDDLAKSFGMVPLVVSLEVVEHCFDPRKIMETFAN